MTIGWKTKIISGFFGRVFAPSIKAGAAGADFPPVILAAINRVTDPNTGGGVVLSTSQTFCKVNGQFVATNGDPVSNHGLPPHDAALTANGVEFFKINNIPVNTNISLNTCGHIRNSSQNWFKVGAL